MDGFEHEPTRAARFFSAHFVFTLGRFCLDVPYDPGFISLAKNPPWRFAPSPTATTCSTPNACWSGTTTGARAPKHWSDHQRWSLRNERSMQRYRKMIREGLAGLDPARSSWAGMAWERCAACAITNTSAA
jgi:hypothetical protein